MQHAVTQPTPPFTVAGGALRIHQIPALQDNLVWLLECVATGAVAVVDGPPQIDPILDYLSAHNLTLSMILNTHTHWDHIGVNQALQRKGLLDDLGVIGSAHAAEPIPGLTRAVDEGDTLTVGDVPARVLNTQGHQNGHITYVFDGAILCGDTLFAGGCGYLFDGPPETMFASLLKLAALDGDTLVCCAHEYTQDNLRFAWFVEPDNAALAARIRSVWALRAQGRCTVPSTLEEERATNPFLRPGSPTLLARVAAALPERDLSTPAAVFAATRALKDSGAHTSLTDADLPL